MASTPPPAIVRIDAGNLLRAIAIPFSEFDITVTTVDWARVSVEVQSWQLPPVVSTEGTRRAIEITADGRHVLEVLERDDSLVLRVTAIDKTSSRIVVLDREYRPGAPVELPKPQMIGAPHGVALMSNGGVLRD